MEICECGSRLSPADNTKALATSIDKPVATLDLQAKRGPAWPVQVTVDGGIPDSFRLQVSVHEVEDGVARANWLKGEPVSFMKPLVSCMSTLDSNGRGTFTQCGTSGKLFLSIGGNPLEVGQITTEFLVDPSFDMTKVTMVKPDAVTGKVELTDEKRSKRDDFECEPHRDKRAAAHYVSAPQD